MDSAFIRSLTQVIALVLFFLVPLLNLFRIDLVNQHFFLLTEKFSFNEGFTLLLAILTLVFTFVSISQWFGRQFCGWLCPHNTFVGYLIRVTKWNILSNPTVRNVIDLLLSIIFAPIITFCLLAYFINPLDIWHTIISGNFLNITGIAFIVLLVFFFIMINRLRYKFCQNACPYGMLQMILSNGNQKRSLSKTMFSGVGLVLLVIMTALISCTIYFATTSAGFYTSLTKKVNGVPSEKQLIYSFDLSVENLKNNPVHYTISYKGLPQTWQSTTPSEADLAANEIKEFPLVFRIGEADLGKNYIIDVVITSETGKTVTKKLTLFPIRK
ncbi:4Fe-4S binding protein [Brevibacillus ginsengisoli]|uniref:4Fe-4S binding protein n=1 Tax=Brevibacillus ginsengisoli TaxID=363854 RepID=UPI003CEB8726